MKEELCEEVVEVRMVSDRVMAVFCSCLRGCVEVDLWACSIKWKRFGIKAVF